LYLLAYYIAAVNIENAYHDALEQKDYEAFEGICLTDTFQLGETDGSDKLFKDMFPQNSARVAKQKKAPLKVIMGNPPYSIGQKSANDNAQNQDYPKLDAKIASTYAAASTAGLNKSLYDAYIKAFRWSTDRLDKNGGIVCFVSNGAWLDGNSTDGFRKCLEKEFTSIYVFNLRGNARTSGELRQKEAGNVFGGGSRTPIAITLLVKNPLIAAQKVSIHYYDIGDYLSREEKLVRLKTYRTVSNESFDWKTLQPNEHGDWISQRNDAFGEFTPLSPEKKFSNSNKSYFTAQSNGILTAKDSWLINSSKSQLARNIRNMLTFYNEQRLAFQKAKQKGTKQTINEFVTYDSTKISWSDLFLRDAERNIPYEFESKSFFPINYRPFNKQQFSYDKKLIQRTYQMLKLFPNGNDDNLVIGISSMNSTRGISVSITDSIVDYHFNGDTQCFSLYFYDERDKQVKTLFDADNDNEFIRRDGISDFILEKAKKQYGKNVTKEDIFYYVYGFLHSPEYRETFASDLKKMLPRLPLVEDVKDFWAFSKAGRKLAELHINYETVAPFKGVKVSGADSEFFTVEKMRFPKKDQKDTIHYNSKITISNIPAKAYEYIVNGKSAIEWIMERYQVTTHKESGIKNDPNDWSKEVGNPRYILDLLLSIVNVSVQTVEIVDALPKVKFE
jgi:predicted helicase